MTDPIDPGKSKFSESTLVIYFQRYPGTAGTDAERGIAKVPFTLKVDGKVVQTGSTGSKGEVTLKFAPDKTAVLEILGSVYEIRVRDKLEPVANAWGAQRRLDQLGYELGTPDGVLGRRTDDATLNFQADNGLDTDGICETKTQNKLKAQFGK